MHQDDEPDMQVIDLDHEENEQDQAPNAYGATHDNHEHPLKHTTSEERVAKNTAYIVGFGCNGCGKVLNEPSMSCT